MDSSEEMAIMKLDYHIILWQVLVELYIVKYIYIYFVILFFTKDQSLIFPCIHSGNTYNHLLCVRHYSRYNSVENITVNKINSMFSQSSHSRLSVRKVWALKNISEYPKGQNILLIILKHYLTFSVCSHLHWWYQKNGGLN